MSFYTWISQFPDSAHWCDEQRFLTFMKTICRFNARKWKDQNYLKSRILKEKPNFDQDFLDDILSLSQKLFDFYKTSPLPDSWIFEDGEIEDGFYLERGIKDGIKYEKRLPINN